MFKSLLKNIFGINKKEINFTENIKTINEPEIEPEIEFTEISTLNKRNNNDLTMTNNTEFQIFKPYSVGTLDASQYKQINLKDTTTRWAYLIINNETGDYFTTISIAGLDIRLRGLYGKNYSSECSDDIYMVTCGKYETIIPSKVELFNDGELIECLLVKNLKHVQLKQILKKRGLEVE